MARVAKGMVYKGIAVDPVTYPKFMLKCRRGGTTGRFILQRLMEAWIDDTLDYGTRGLEYKGQLIVKALDRLRPGEELPVMSDAVLDDIAKKAGVIIGEDGRASYEMDDSDDHELKEAA